jgi:hypothetical protein
VKLPEIWVAEKFVLVLSSVKFSTGRHYLYLRNKFSFYKHLSFRATTLGKISCSLLQPPLSLTHFLVLFSTYSSDINCQNILA